MHRRIALAVRVVLLAIVAALLPAVVAAGPADGATIAPDPAHPYSSPVWFPLRDASQSDCEKSNPDPLCVHAGKPYHGYWAMDIDEVSPFPTNDPVMAMGAGQVHIGSTDYRCGPAHAGLGANVWIDHGNGVRSIYGHLAGIAVTEGQLVTPTTRLAYVGNSGYAGCLAHQKWRYVYVAVKHDRSYVEIPRLYACKAGVEQSWPQVFGYPSWNTIPVHKPLPATDNSCIVKAATPNRPAAPTAYRVKAGELHYFWTKPSNVVRSVLEIQEWHPSLNAFTADRKLTVTGSGVYVSGMLSGRPYRARLWFYNYSGYSAASGWTVKTPL
jgi:peptidase M23-like protein